MDQFIAVALAHFLALAIPGVDFFLIVRTAAAHGWRSASGVCVGIAAANGLFIAAAFGGLAAIENEVALAGIELAGGTFLVWMGVVFARANVSLGEGGVDQAKPLRWISGLGLGAASGLLNPKNLLFYVSLAAAVSGASGGRLALYGIWMFTVVLVWDLMIAAAMGMGRGRAKLATALPWITRAAAVVVTVLGVGMLITALRTLAA